MRAVAVALTLVLYVSGQSPAVLSPGSRANITRGVGVYRDLQRRTASLGTPAHTVLLVSANFGYALMLRSWMCRARELGLMCVLDCMDPYATGARERPCVARSNLDLYGSAQIHRTRARSEAPRPACR